MPHLESQGGRFVYRCSTEEIDLQFLTLTEGVGINCFRGGSLDDTGSLPMLLEPLTLSPGTSSVAENDHRCSLRGATELIGSDQYRAIRRKDQMDACFITFEEVGSIFLFFSDTS